MFPVAQIEATKQGLEILDDMQKGAETAAELCTEISIEIYDVT